MRFIRKARINVNVIAVLVGVVIFMSVSAFGEELKLPAGCRPAKGADAGAGGYADKIVHEKTGIELVLVPTGDLTMGAGRQAYQVTISIPFYMGKTEVTNAQYRRFVEVTGYNGKPDVDPDPDYDLYLRHWRGKSIMSKEDDYPIVWVSWKNAKAFCEWSGFALPSEAQWEYACRAGTTTRYYFGDDQKEFDKYGWANTSNEYHTHPVAGKLPNAWGLYDMLGNVWEWVEDDYVSYEYVDKYGSPPTDGSARLEGKMTKVVRGGSWGNSAVCGSGTRHNSAPTNASSEFGFRVMLPLEK